MLPKPGWLVQFLNLSAPFSSYNIKKIDIYKRTTQLVLLSLV